MWDLLTLFAINIFFNSYYFHGFGVVTGQDEKVVEALRLLANMFWVIFIFNHDYCELDQLVVKKLDNLEKRIADLQVHLEEIDAALFEDKDDAAATAAPDDAAENGAVAKESDTTADSATEVAAVESNNAEAAADAAAAAIAHSVAEVALSENINEQEVISGNRPTGPTRCVLRSSKTTELSN